MDRLEKILNEKIWTTGGIRSGKDVGTAELRLRTIRNAAIDIRRAFVLVDTKHVDTILKAIADYVVAQIAPAIETVVAPEVSLEEKDASVNTGEHK